MSLSVFRRYAPSRPPTERDTLHMLDGSPVQLGCLASTGTVVDNDGTANPFATATPAALLTDADQMRLTLAGRVLMFQSDADGYLLPSDYALASGNAKLQTLVVQGPTVVPGATACGPLVSAKERVLIIMRSDEGWVQWLPVTGSGNCYVWELL